MAGMGIILFIVSYVIVANQRWRSRTLDLLDGGLSVWVTFRPLWFASGRKSLSLGKIRGQANS